MNAARTQREIDFQLTRKIDAPRELVYQAWTEAERLEQWWGPPGISVRVAKLDLAPGGTFLYAMQMPGGPEMFGKFVYRELEPNRLLTFVVSFCDADEAITSHPMSPTWPKKVLSGVELFDDDGQTRLEMWATPFEASEEEERTFLEGRAGFQQGTSGALDQLEAYLATL